MNGNEANETLILDLRREKFHLALRCNQRRLACGRFGFSFPLQLEEKEKKKKLCRYERTSQRERSDLVSFYLIKAKAKANIVT